jgi:hypothetical protein
MANLARLDDWLGLDVSARLINRGRPDGQRGRRWIGRGVGGAHGADNQRHRLQLEGRGNETAEGAKVHAIARANDDASARADRASRAVSA